MNTIIFALILIQLLIVALIDFKTKKISNYWVVGNILLTVVCYIAFPYLYPFTWELFLFPVGFVVVGFILFLMGIMGAGDSKYLAALFGIIPVEFHLPFFEKLLLSTILIGSILLAYKTVINLKLIRAYLWSQYWQGLKDIIKSKFSYAPVILLAWLLLGVQEWK